MEILINTDKNLGVVKINILVVRLNHRNFISV